MVEEPWGTVALGQVVTLQRGFDLPYRVRKPGDVPIITSSGPGGWHNDARAPGPGVVTGRYGTIGDVFFIQGAFWPLNTTLFVSDFHGNDPLFASYLLRTVDFHSHSGKSGVPGVNRNDLHALPVRVPRRVPEQLAIAGALRDADELMGALEKLIAKKRDLKQAAMQQLLTGKTRLPGFSGEWGVKRLEDMGSSYGGLTGKTKADFGKGPGCYVPFLNVMNNVVVDLGDLESVRIVPGESQNQVRKGDLLFNGSSETPEEVGMCAALLEEVDALYLNSFCFGLRLGSGSDGDALYLAYFFRSREGREVLRSLAQGATRYNLSKTAFLGQAFKLPGQPEQTAIAAVLSDMDAEIDALEARLAKAQALTQGMMQELLTGRIRLV